MTGARSDLERWHAVLDALSDETAEMSDKMIMREFGADADQTSSIVRNLIRHSVGDVNVTPYEATRDALDKEKFIIRESSLPRTAEERRSLLTLILTGGHRWSDSATLAFRELDDPSDLSDEEIAGILEDLAELNGEGDS
ncbi:hypothetical protein [Alcanivorax sp. 24]|uniref:hypothetical protein n=1 Tax=Alcanivorax sp. 24 TaxID=2545266 RepID=UPI00105D25CD|nr:hypothetical protein [Alcanivorax sp. 24]